MGIDILQDDKSTKPTPGQLKGEIKPHCKSNESGSNESHAQEKVTSITLREASPEGVPGTKYLSHIIAAFRGGCDLSSLMLQEILLAEFGVVEEQYEVKE